MAAGYSGHCSGILPAIEEERGMEQTEEEMRDGENRKRDEG